MRKSHFSQPEGALRGAVEERKLQETPYCSWTGNCPSGGGNPNAAYCNASEGNCMNDCDGAAYCFGGNSGGSGGSFEPFCSWTTSNCRAGAGNPNSSWCNAAPENCVACGGLQYCTKEGEMDFSAYCENLKLDITKGPDTAVCGHNYSSSQFGLACGWIGPGTDAKVEAGVRNRGYYNCPRDKPNCSEHGWCGRYNESGYTANCNKVGNYLAAGNPCWDRAA